MKTRSSRLNRIVCKSQIYNLNIADQGGRCFSLSSKGTFTNCFETLGISAPYSPSLLRMPFKIFCDDFVASKVETCLNLWHSSDDNDIRRHQRLSTGRNIFRFLPGVCPFGLNTEDPSIFSNEGQFENADISMRRGTQETKGPLTALAVPAGMQVDSSRLSGCKFRTFAASESDKFFTRSEDPNSE